MLISRPSAIAPWPLYLALSGLAVLLAWPGANRALFLAFNHAAAALPPGLWLGLSVVGEWAVVAILLAVWASRRPGRWPAALSGYALALVLSALFKLLFAEARPPLVLAAGSFHLLDSVPFTNAFPSGHSTAAALLATLLAHGAAARSRAALALLAAGIMLSRVAVGLHWPVDLLAGGLLGWACARLALACRLAVPALDGARPAGVALLLTGGYAVHLALGVWAAADVEAGWRLLLVAAALAALAIAWGRARRRA
ncbi:PAP2 superfamily protein [Crenobacter luteus]|uniref:phosphatase PAP2 family protein n=1 Tax=Crenobacter luteus TaxID=1452487 RepID=UPI001042BA91|nr:phosphatase PAP2 family protein [Crenobacter luteus]TCP10978.1 PAP2 superfamily protein [Crenobacter luteus]